VLLSERAVLGFQEPEQGESYRVEEPTLTAVSKIRSTFEIDKTLRGCVTWGPAGAVMGQTRFSVGTDLRDDRGMREFTFFQK